MLVQSGFKCQVLPANIINKKEMAEHNFSHRDPESGLMRCCGCGKWQKDEYKRTHCAMNWNWG